MSEARALASMSHVASCVNQVSRHVGRLGRMLGVATVLALTGCAGSGPFSPVTDLNEKSSSATYTVRPGDTLNSISRQTGVSVDQLRALNGISNPSLIRVGQRLRLGEGASTSMAGGDSSVTVTPIGAPQTTSVTRAADAGKLDLIWPVKGEIIQRFTPETKGIDVAGNVGDPVVAAAAGKVVYAGNGVRGLGNLVIIDHGGGFITAYAHNERLLAKNNDTVSKGAEIAKLGQSDTTSPRLHFEVRRNGTPVNPLSYLPAQGS